MLPFFGLTSQDRFNSFSEIDEICTHGNGYTWEVVYNWPIWLRKWTYKRIEQRFQRQQEEIDKTTNQITAGNIKQQDIARPGINPTYRTKAAKK